MIGVVEAGSNARVRVLGLPIAMRAAFALQSAGATALALVGEERAWLADSLGRDDRLRVPIVTDVRGPRVVACDGAVIDARAVRSLVAREAPSTAGEGALRWEDDVAKESATVTVEGVALVVRGAADQGIARSRLLASLRKPQDGWIATLLNRRVSLAITRWLTLTGIRPNTLSIMILAIGLYGAWLAAQPSRFALAIGGFLFQLQSILDGCDGELSRLTFRGSRTGEWLDTVGDDVTNYSFFAGAAIGVHRAGFGDWPLAIGAAGVLIGVVTSAIEYAYLIRIGSGDLLKYPLGFGNDPEPTKSPAGIARLLGALRPAFKRDFFVFLSMLAAFAGPVAMGGMLVLFTAGAIATCSAVLASEVRRRRVRSAA